MKIFNDRWEESSTLAYRCVPALLLVLLGLTVILEQAVAQNGPAADRQAIWYEGTVVSGLLSPNDPAVAHIPNDLPAHISQPAYRVFTAGIGSLQDTVIGVIPGDIGYTGWWDLKIILDFSGRDTTVDPYTSVGAIEVLLCTIPGFPGNIGTCIANGTPLIDFTENAQTDDLLFNVPIVLGGPPPKVCD